MSERFFVDSPLQGQTAILKDAEAHHLIHVLRAERGDDVVLFDGVGHEARARVAVIGRSQAELQLLSCEAISRESSPAITLAVALPKGDRQRWLVEKAVELGVQRLVPLETRHGVAAATPATLGRLRKIVIEASKQCGRNLLMVIDEPCSWTTFASACAAPVRWLAHFGGEPIAPVVRAVATEASGHRAALPTEYALAIGSEGGFADEEVAAGITAGWRVVDLGPRILRVDTAATFLVAAARLTG